MKKVIPFIILLSFECIAQSVEVNYYENYKAPNKEQFNLMPKNVQITYKENTFSYKLISDGNASLYQNEKFKFKIIEEKIASSGLNEVGDTIESIITSSGIDLKTKEKIYYKDFKKNKSYNQQYYDEIISIVDSIAINKWQLLDETEIILGYPCKKAVTKYYGKDVYAWYTEEIPIADGPSFYSGLPGLILKISSKFQEIIAYNISFKNETLLSPPIFTGKIFSYKTLKEYIENKNKERN
jgi:GLPGLI family protein